MTGLPEGLSTQADPAAAIPTPCFFYCIYVHTCSECECVSVWVCAYVCTSVQEYDHIPVEMAIRMPFGCLSGSIGTQPLKTVGVTVYVHILEMSPSR